jgi:Tol biopolymer transport system component
MGLPSRLFASARFVSIEVAVPNSRERQSQAPLPEPRTGAWTFYWSPDGKAFDYVSEADGWTDIWEEPLSGGDPKQLTHFGSGQVNDFHWSRDAKRLLVVWGSTSDDVVFLTGQQALRD